MELLYNPERMDEADLRSTFVGREELIEELLGVIRNQPEGAGVQHVVIKAPRGLGKTSLLLMLRLRIRDSGLAEKWYPLKLPEELYGVYDLADLWIEVLRNLAAETNDTSLHERVEKLGKEQTDSEELHDAALALLKDWCSRHGRRVVVIVENFGQLLEQLGDEREQARLRNVLMNEGFVMLLASVTTIFREARSYDQPLYNFFKWYDLDYLDLDQMRELLCRRAKLDGNEGFAEKLEQNAVRLKVLAYFTGGSPRLALMLYRVLTLSEVSEVRQALEKLLDEITPYYQAKTASLPPQQRKILDQLARHSSVTHEAQTPSQIAAATRLPANQVSAQLKRLLEGGYVSVAHVSGRNSYYALSERLYAIWYQMRFGRGRMIWLVDFLRGWYSRDEFELEADRLDKRFRELVEAGGGARAREVLYTKHYLVEAMPDEQRMQALLSLIPDYVGLGDTDALAEALDAADGVLKLDPTNATARRDRGFVLLLLERYEEALAALETMLESSTERVDAWFLKGAVLVLLERYEEALAAFETTLESNPERVDAWFLKGVALGKLGRYEEGLAACEQTLELNPKHVDAWYNKGFVVLLLGRYEEALAAFEQTLELDPKHVDAGFIKGAVLGPLGRPEEALAAFERALDLDRNLLAGGGADTLLLGELVRCVKLGYSTRVRKLIQTAGIEESLFPLARALDYIESGDSALIEKLSPEVKGAVEDIVKELEIGNGAPQASKKTKAKPKRRGRSVKSRKRLD